MQGIAENERLTSFRHWDTMHQLFNRYRIGQPMAKE
jgi:hypothetical protein